MIEDVTRNDRRGYQKVCSDYAVYGIKKHGLTRSDCTSFDIKYS